MTVILLRHGRSTSNTAGVLAGRSEGVDLDDKGREQAVGLIDRIGDLRIRAVVSSPLLRCRRTLEPLTEALSLEPLIDERLAEVDYGEWTGRKIGELAKEPLWRTVQEQPSAVRFPGGESMVEMAARAQRTVRDLDREIAARHGDDAVWLAVSHGDVIKAILADALGVHLDHFQRILVDPASISVVRLTATRPYVACVNTTAGDLTAMLTPPQRPRRAGKRSRGAGNGEDAAVGGGLGAGAR